MIYNPGQMKWFGRSVIAATCQCCYQPVTTAPPGYLPDAQKTVDALNPLFLWEEPDLHRRYSGHDIYRLHWRCCYNLHRYISMHRQGDTVWLETKQIGKFINPLTREMHNERLGPGGDYDVVCFQKRFKVLSRQIPAPNLYQHSYHASHHFPKEMGSCNADNNTITNFNNLHAIKIYEGALPFFFGSTKRTEIVKSFEAGGCVAHGAQVERVAHPPNILRGVQP